VTVKADRGRLAQALGNVLANAVEHGDGVVQLRARRRGRHVELEVVNGPRGRGVAIATAAARDAGGDLSFTTGSSGGRAVLELPLA
jgi:signal transduction histidine kinase